MTVKESFPKNMKFLKEVRKTINDFCKNNNIKDEIVSMIEMSIDEIVANIIEHSTGISPFEINVNYNNDVFECTIIDDGDKYSLDEIINKFDLDDYVKKRKQRGLGIYIVNNFMDDIKLERKNRKNYLTLTKTINNNEH